MKKQLKISIKVSGRHVHLSESDLERLFGSDYQLTKDRDIDQPGQFATKEKVTIKGPRGLMENVAIVGPVRGMTQVEISKTDAIKLGLEPPIAKSVHQQDVNPALITIKGLEDTIEVKAAIISHRHIHISPSQAKEKELSDGQEVRVNINGKRGLIFKNVLVRVDTNFDYSMHIDTDEANAAGIDREGQGEIIM